MKPEVQTSSVGYQRSLQVVVDEPIIVTITFSQLVQHQTASSQEAWFEAYQLV